MKRNRIDIVFSSIFLFNLSFLVASCAPQSDESHDVTAKNFVEANDPHLVRVIGDNKNQFVVLGKSALAAKLASAEIFSPHSQEALKALSPLISGTSGMSASGAGDTVVDPGTQPDSSPQSLIFGMPFKMLNQPLVFGSVITQVSDQKNEDLGGLKLSDIPPFQAMLKLHSLTGGAYSVSVVSCDADCTQTANQKSVLEIPVSAVDSQKQVVYINLASLGKELDLVALREGDPSLESFKAKSSDAVRFDYSDSTLVFDIVAHLVPKLEGDASASPNETLITNRWYLKSMSSFNPSFKSRKATPGVGFFMTERNSVPLIQRWDFDRKTKNQGVKYYIKHVPAEYQPAFADAFEAWNTKMLPVIGKKLLSYEFISEDDPRNKLLVAGDVRFNVLEWDLINKAGYGGLGPSLANQYTGELFAANVLVQGPTIIDLYTKWFKANEEANELRARGFSETAEAVLIKAKGAISDSTEKMTSRTFRVKYTPSLEMTVRSQDPSLQDPIMSKDNFDLIPPGYDFKKYMTGYFKDMLEHELGHNLGLRHNFRGNLGAADGTPAQGKVSRSVMEYLGRGFRYLDGIGPYDVMAMAYGYTGALPRQTHWYCTDEDVANLQDPSKSAECSRDDGSNNPYEYFKSRLIHAEDLLVSRGKKTAPEWTVADMKVQLNQSLVGMGTYAVSASQTSSSWTNFFRRGDHPSQASQVHSFVLSSVKSVLCDPQLKSEADLKETPEGAAKVRQNLVELRQSAEKILKPAFSSEELACAAEPLN